MLDSSLAFSMESGSAATAAFADPVLLGARLELDSGANKYQSEIGGPFAVAIPAFAWWNLPPQPPSQDSPSVPQHSAVIPGLADGAIAFRFLRIGGTKPPFARGLPSYLLALTSH